VVSVGCLLHSIATLNLRARAITSISAIHKTDFNGKAEYHALLVLTT
jgi:hypothetical protein